MVFFYLLSSSQVEANSRSEARSHVWGQHRRESIQGTSAAAGGGGSGGGGGSSSSTATATVMAARLLVYSSTSLLVYSSTRRSRTMSSHLLNPRQ